MSFMQPTTKEDIRVMNQNFASIFNNNSQGMNNSSANNNNNSSNNNSNHNSNRPKRVIVCGRRRVTKPQSFNSNSNRCPQLRNTFGTNRNNGNNNNNNSNNNSRKNNEMNGNRLSKEERLKRKRKFDVMQTGSDELADLMHQAQTNRIPNLTLCYVRKISLPYGIYKDNKNDKNDKNGNDNRAVSDNSQNNNNNNKNGNFNFNNNGNGDNLWNMNNSNTNFNFGSFAFETESKIPEKIQADTEKFVNDDQKAGPPKDAYSIMMKAAHCQKRKQQQIPSSPHKMNSLNSSSSNNSSVNSNDKSNNNCKSNNNVGNGNGNGNKGFYSIFGKSSNNNGNNNDNNNKNNGNDVVKTGNNWSGFGDISMDNSGNNTNNDSKEKETSVELSRFGVPLREGDLQGTMEEWVTVFKSYDDACNVGNWKIKNKNGKIEEYQINCKDWVYIVNLDSALTKNSIEILNDNEQLLNVENFVISNGYSGYLLNKEIKLYKPFKYWRLVDDNKIKSISQCLISDMFRKQSMNITIDGWNIGNDDN